jgi:hypothetical protein
VTAVSRYARAGDVDPATGLRTGCAAGGVVTHTLAEGDRLDRLALRYYRESRAWWRLCDADPDRPWPLDVVGRGPHRTVHIPLAAPDRWARVLPQLLAVPGVVTAVLAEPPAGASTGQGTAVAVVVHDRAARSAGDIAALLGDLGLEPLGYEAGSSVGRPIAVPTTVVG